MQRRTSIVHICDDLESEKMLGRVLTSTQYRIFSSLPGAQALRMCMTLHPGLIFVAHDLPSCDARDLVPAIRMISQTPIIVLSACATDLELVELLSLGANDYLGKPFHSGVLVARTQAALRSRAVQVAGSPDLINGFLRLDLVRHAVFVANQPVSFTPKEFDLLRYFLTNRGKMLTHRDILRAVWGPAHCDDAAYLRVYVGQIRRKIESCATNHSMIKSECGVGYRMEVIGDERGRGVTYKHALTDVNHRNEQQRRIWGNGVEAIQHTVLSVS